MGKVICRVIVPILSWLIWLERNRRNTVDCKSLYKNVGIELSSGGFIDLKAQNSGLGGF